MKLFATLSFSIIALSAFAQSPTSPALGFNVFVEADAKLKTNETEGPVAICGDLVIEGNYQVSTNNAGVFKVGNVTTSLVIGGKIDFKSGNSLQVNQNGYVKVGDCKAPTKVWYKDQNGANSPIRITKNNNYNTTPFLHLQANAQQLGVSATNNPICQGNVIDFAAAFQVLKNNSHNLSLCAHNAQLTNPNGQNIPNTNLPNQVKINLQNGKNVLNITGADLNRVQVFTYNQKPNANRYLIINVDAPGNFDWTVWNQAGVGQQDCPYILYNFYNTSKLNIKGSSTIEGTLFAPYADVIKKTNQANIEGQVICKSFEHAGGEVHFANFLPQELGCAAPIPTVTASFDASPDTLCLSGNQITFTNNSFGSNNLTYWWDFGDGYNSNQTSPTHVYQQAGTYVVTLAAIASFGTDTASRIVVVHPNPNASFSVNDTVQELTNNNFALVLSQPQANLTYSWNFGDGNSSTSAAPTHQYTALGAYIVQLNITNSAGCSAQNTLLVVVQADSCSSGNDGGIESKSLEGLISEMHFKQATQQLPSYNPSEASIFVPMSLNNLKSASAARSATLEQFIPQQSNGAGQAYISTPWQLIDITNAEEMISVDYKIGNQNQAAVLASISLNEPYNHTKYTCDRFLRGEVIYLDSLQISGMPFILFAIKKFDGLIEYGVEFSAGFNAGAGEFGVQSAWLIHEYATQDTFYNFQIWAKNPLLAIELTKQILTALDTDKPLVQAGQFNLPKVYISKGSLSEGRLILTLVNSSADPIIDIKWCEKQNENAAFDTTHLSAITNENNTIELDFEVGDTYEFDLYFSLNGKDQDKLYMADANWGLDFDKTFTSVQQFNITNQPDRIFDNELALYRNVSLRANTADYITLYKDVVPGAQPVDLSNYIGLRFKAKGNGPIVIRTFADGITNWRAQYTTNIDLSSDWQTFQIPFTDFTSDSFSTTMPVEAIKTLSFVYESQSFNYEDVAFDLEEVGFVSEFVFTGLSKLNAAPAFSVFPNPTDGELQLVLETETNESAVIRLFDVAGRQVLQTTLELTAGQNHSALNLREFGLPNGAYQLQLQVNGQTHRAKIVMQ